MAPSLLGHYTFLYKRNTCEVKNGLLIKKTDILKIILICKNNYTCYQFKVLDRVLMPQFLISNIPEF